MIRPLRRDAGGPAIVEAAVSDIGMVRRANEDSILRRPDAGLWAVADGMGGHEAGEWASAVICETLETAPVTGDFNTDCARVAESLRAANKVIHDRADAKATRMGSTVAALLLGDDRAALFWVGDSRVYRLRAGRLARMTTDHTQVQSLIDRGMISAEQARAHPMSHVLSRAVGAAADLDIESEIEAVETGDLFLICSDGLHGVVAEAEIEQALLRDPPAGACEALLSLSHARGAPDNVSLIVVALG